MRKMFSKKQIENIADESQSCKFKQLFIDAGDDFYSIAIPITINPSKDKDNEIKREKKMLETLALSSAGFPIILNGDSTIHVMKMAVTSNKKVAVSIDDSLIHYTYIQIGLFKLYEDDPL